MPSLRPVDFEPKDLPLREDVSLLGGLVGDVLREQGGDELFEAVESARLRAIECREREEGIGPLAEVIGSPTVDRAADLVRAFSTYFEVVNLAERCHRIRRRRDYLRQGISQSGGLEALFLELADGGVELKTVADWLATVRIEPVFTAHPTESTRRVLLEKEQNIGRLLVERQGGTLTPPEERANLARIKEAVTSGWQTLEHPEARPTVADEREHVLFYVLDVLYRVVPPFYEEVGYSLDQAFGSGAGVKAAPSQMFRFASWVGGDMDGNPNVSAATIEASLKRQRELIVARYDAELAGLLSHLTQSSERVGVSQAVSDAIASYSREFARIAQAIGPRHRGMPYRLLVSLMRERLAATLRDELRGYGDAERFVEDLRLIAQSLEENRGAEAGLFAVRRAIRRVQTFGFHLVTLDVRQDTQVHREALAELLDDPQWPDRSAGERIERLTELLGNEATLQGSPGRGGAAARSVLAVFETIARCQETFGPRAVGPYIISMASDVDDVLSVLLLARWAGLGSHQGDVPLDIAPLFETVGDLESASRVVRAPAGDPIYASHLERRGSRQVVMIGYSDSSKDGGIVASRWALQEAQSQIVDAARDTGIRIELFHGRGGTVGRGGGKTHQAVLAAPAGSVGGRLRLTEQGEVIDEKYGLRGIALRSLERLAASVTSVVARDEGGYRDSGWTAAAVSPPAEWLEAMATLASSSRDHYRAMVYAGDGFIEYFRTATPIDVIERMSIGSRPPSRRSGRGVENLRAIPWVFSWTQNRQTIPGWFGLGTGIASAVAAHGEALVSQMALEWPFFGTLLQDAEMAVAKSDMRIGQLYARLAPEGRWYDHIVDEFERTVTWILRLRRKDTLLEDDPTLRRAIRLRNPYVDPMSCLQVDLLERWRAGERRDEELLRALLATINGIARGLQNTG